MSVWIWFILCTSAANQDHIIPILSAIVMMTTAIIGLTYHAEGKRLFKAWDSIYIFTAFVVNIILLFLLRGGY